MIDFTDDTPVPGPPAAPPISGETPTSMAPVDAASALDRMAKAIEDLVTSNKADNARSLETNQAAAKRARYTLVLMGAAVASLAYGTMEIRSTSTEVSHTAAEVASLAAKVEAIQAEQVEIRTSAEEAAERAAEAAEGAPLVEPTPAVSAAAGRPARPAGARLVFKQPNGSQSAVAFPLGAPTAVPVTSTSGASSSTGGE